MSDNFNDPHITINRVYTRRGDQGETALVGGQRVAKDDPRIEAYGTVDELNAIVGLCRVSLDAEVNPHPDLRWLSQVLFRVQNELFNLGSLLATLPADVHPRQPRIVEGDVTRLEVEMDRCNEDLPTLRSFVLPGGCRLNAELHLARTVCRRAERMLVTLAHTGEVDMVSVRYLNRLSDAFFVWSRLASLRLGVPEVLWDPNKGENAS